MKAKLEFDLDDHSDRLSHKRAVSATDVYLALHDFDNELRNMVKYGKLIETGQDIPLPEGYHKVTEKESELLHHVVSHIRLTLANQLEERGINMDDLE